ncbi:hypothetical protein Slin14017_G020710 [Septoria linicola]|nr:hypothetical protein Slin14017_G020710 [Septoria linicola]
MAVIRPSIAPYKRLLIFRVRGFGVALNCVEVRYAYDHAQPRHQMRSHTLKTPIGQPVYFDEEGQPIMEAVKPKATNGINGNH